VNELVAILSAATMASISSEVGAVAAENSQKLSGGQIRAKLTGMQLTDEVHLQKAHASVGGGCQRRDLSW
jgi:hypothetical protein